MIERRVERAFVKSVRAKGGVAYKMVSPGRSGVPDRLVLLPVALEHIALVGRYIYFAEIKSSVGRISKRQETEHCRLRSLGYAVDIVRPEPKPKGKSV